MSKMRMVLYGFCVFILLLLLIGGGLPPNNGNNAVESKRSVSLYQREQLDLRHWQLHWPLGGPFVTKFSLGMTGGSMTIFFRCEPLPSSMT